MKKKKSILFVGPVPPPITGQSVAFYRAYKGIQAHNKFLVNQNVTGKDFVSTITLILLAILKIIFYLLFRKIEIVYFTCSRSKRGSLLDVFLIQLAKLFRARVINHLHGLDFEDFYNSLPGIYKKIVENSYMKIDVSIVLLEEIKEQFSAVSPEMRIEVVPNFYEEILEQINTKRESEEMSLLYLSNIMRSKGILELLDAFCSLIKKNRNISLTIAGGFLGDYLSGQKEIEKKFFEKFHRLKSMAKGRIDYLGVVYGKKKLELFENSDIFILPTYYKTEAFPLAIIEAMRAGNVIITTDHNYLPKIVSEKNGCLVEVKSSEAIERAIANFAKNRGQMREIQKYNINHAKRNYPLNLYIKRLTAIFESV